MASLGALVSSEWLFDNLSNSQVKCLDSTWVLGDDTRILPSGYIPGSYQFDLDEIADLSSPYQHMLPSPDKFAAALSDMGIGNSDIIIAYDRLGVFSSPRLWWTCRMFGHANVAVLNGGLPAWTKAGYPVDIAPAQPLKNKTRTYIPKSPLSGVINQDEILSLLDKLPQIVDARPQARFLGQAPEPRPGLRSGHIPHSLSLPFKELIDEQGRIKDKATLSKAIDRIGLDLKKPIITSCGSGITATGLALIFYILGARDIRVYDASWAEWGASDAPVNIG